MKNGWWKSKSCRLISMMVLTSSFFLVELIVGNITNSIALVADSFHMLSDIIALMVGLAAVLIAEKNTPKNTFGWQRAEVLGALVNSVFLISLCFTIVVDSLKRFLQTEPVSNPSIVLIVGSIGFLINVVGLGLLSTHGVGHGHSHGGHGHKPKTRSVSRSPIINSSSEDNTPSDSSIPPPVTANGTAAATSPEDVGVSMITEGVDEEDVFVANGSAHLNMRGVFLHVLGDALGSVVVMISATIIWKVDANWTIYVDPALSLFIVIIISSSTIPLLWQSSQILLLSIPQDLNMNQIRVEILALPYVKTIHDLHLWQLSGDKNIFTAHVCFNSQDDYTQGERSIKDILHKQGIHSSTIQPEFETSERHSSVGSMDEESCLLMCNSQKCEAQTCCASRKPSIKQLPPSPPEEDSPTRSHGFLRSFISDKLRKAMIYKPV
ncbi:proton-coupled zinc antiporter SLC30A1-like isoform X2 [Apostichopus japonicus]|uniref:proton-coupled zinc antiporter SLC30A1-like isoform X2 n=1 Tax=Stichopus japonicus TaxID=307972 RepID=UPI003AB32918